MIYQMRKEVMCTPLLSSITRDILGLGSDKAMIRHRVGCVRMQQTGAFSFFFLKDIGLHAKLYSFRAPRRESDAEISMDFQWWLVDMTVSLSLYKSY